MQKIAKNCPSAHHNSTLLGYIFATRHVSTIWKKNLLNSNISPTCPHNMVNFGLLAAEIGSLVWGPPANLNQFRVLAFLLQRRCSTEASRTLHNVWPSPKLVYCTCICIFVGSCPIMKFCQVQNSLSSKSCSPMLAPLLHGSRVVGVSQTLWHRAEGATYIGQGGHHVGRWPTFWFVFNL